MIDVILHEFGLNETKKTIQPIHQGLINNSWKIGINGDAYVLQKVNHNVFKDPQIIANNISLIKDFLHKNSPGYYFVSPIESSEGSSLVYNPEHGYYRVFPFVSNSHTIDVVQTPGQAYEAAKQFGRFTAELHGFDCTQLGKTIPSFHDLSLRYSMFLQAIKTGNQERVNESDELIADLITLSHIVEEFERIKDNPDFRLRVTHHDTKISNVLFDNKEKGICVIDLDTVMPGYFFSDVGDMMRTYLSPVSEEEIDFSKIHIREEFYEALVQGYYEEMKDELTEMEKKSFFYAGAFMIYMQAIRFLTDYLNDDVYYGARYKQHNLNRAKNQTELLKRLYEKQSVLEGFVVDGNYK